MTKQRANKIVKQVIEDGGEAELRENYSGRCMYGKTTVGVVVSNRGEVDNQRGLRWDNMGMRHICY